MNKSSNSMRKAPSLTTRLGIAVIFILLFGAVIVMVAALTYGRHASQEAYDRLLIGAANQIADSIRIQNGNVIVDIPVSAFELLGLAPDDRITYRVLDQDGKTITGYDDLSPPSNSRDDVEFYKSSFGDDFIRVVAVRRLFSERAYSGAVMVLVGQTTRAREALAEEITRSALLVLAVTGIFMTALAVFAVRSALMPLRKIERELSQRKPHDLTPLDVDVPREIDTLVGVINRFMSRLDRQFSIMRNLIADTSHQLRTPIAALLAQAQLASEEENPPRLRSITERIRNRAMSLGRLTDQLLNHALIIHRADVALRERVDLRTVAIQTAEDSDHDSMGTLGAVRLELPEDPIWVRGDALSLVEACKNLVNNALRHGKPPVELSVGCDRLNAWIKVRDRGDGPADGFWPGAGDRFHKEAGSRSSGAGLGLAIVQEVVKAHAGILEFQRCTGGGFEATIRMPLGESEIQ